MTSIAELIKKQQNRFATNLEDKRQLKGLAKREAAQQAKLNAKPVPIEQTTPKDVSLRRASPSTQNVRTTGPNPAFDVDTQGQVTRGQQGTFQSQEQRNVAKQRQSGQTTTVQPEAEKASLRNQVEITDNKGRVHKVHVGTDGSTISDADLKQQNLQRAQATARDQARAVMNNTKAYSQAQVKAAGEFLSSGAATEAVGEFAGRQTGSAGKGFQQGLSDVAAVEAEVPLQRSAAAPEDVVLKGPAEPAGLRTPPPEVPGAAAVDTPEAPKPQRTVLGNAVDNIKGIPDRLLNKSGTPTPPPAAGPGRVRSGVNLGGRIVGGLALPAIASTIAQSVQDGTVQEDVTEIVKEAPEALGNFVEELIRDPVGMAKEIGQDAVNAIVNLPAGMIAGLGAFNEITSGRNGVIPASGITGAPEQTVFDVVREQFPTFDLFGDGSQSGPPSASDPSAQNITPPPAAGLRQNAPAEAPATVAPASNESFFINQGAGGSGFEGLAGGTGGEAEGEKQFFRDLPQAFSQQERGLGAARNEIAGRGRFSEDNAVANFAGEFAQARGASDRAKLDSFDARTAAGLSSAAGSSANTARTAARKANEDRFKDIDEGLNSENATTVRNTKTGVFGRFRNQLRQGNFDMNAADTMQAANVITREVTDAADVGLGGALWNSLAPALLGGGGRGALDFLNGELSIDGSVPYESIRLDKDGNLMARSTDPATGELNLGFIQDKDTAVFLRQVLKAHEDKGQ